LGNVGKTPTTAGHFGCTVQRLFPSNVSRVRVVDVSSDLDPKSEAKDGDASILDNPSVFG